MKSVVVWGFGVYKWLQMPFLKRLKSEEGSKIHFICGTHKSVEHWKGLDRDGIIDTFTTFNHFFFEYDRCIDPSEKIYAQSRYYEEKYNIFVVDALQADRHLGRGFSAGGVGHPRSELSDKADYIKSANIFNKAIEFWEDYFDKTKADLMLGVSSNIIGKCCAVVARKRGIPIRIFVPAKYKRYSYWAVDEYYSSPEIKRNYESIKDINEFINDEEIEAAIQTPDINDVYQEFMELRSIKGVLKTSWLLIKSKIYKKYYCIVPMGNYKLFESIKSVYMTYRGIKDADRLKVVDGDRLSKMSYILLTLHCEPEAALGVFAPEFNEQLAMIELIAKNLPAGTLLAVKEHIFAVGRRPKEFYTTIQEIPNVVMVSPHEHALDIAKTAKCVAVLSGTLGTEAAILGIPVISFGVHNNFNFLPHVHVVESWKELRPLLSILCKGEDIEEAKRRRQEDGKRYLAALKTSSVNLHWSDIERAKEGPEVEGKADILYSSLMNSLKMVDEYDTVTS